MEIVHYDKMLNVGCPLREVETPLSLYMLSISRCFRTEFEKRTCRRKQDKMQYGFTFHTCFYSFSEIFYTEKV